MATTRTLATTAPRFDAALAILRIVTGSVFAAHGAQKLFSYGFAGVSGAFAQMGVPVAEVVGPAVALLEFFGGLAIVVGLLTRYASAGLAAVMMGAILLVHLPAGFFLPNGVEFPLTLLGGALTLALTGAGRFSLDALLPNRRGDVVGSAERAGTTNRRVA